MLCEACHKKDATVFYRQSVNGNCSERHLCADCAKKENLFSDGAFAGFGDFGGFGPFGEMDRLMNRLWREPFAGLASLPFGGVQTLTREAPVNYQKLKEGLQPFFEKEETGTAAPGKEADAKTAEQTKAAQDLAEMKSRLADLVAAERFEEAAKLRDEIKRKEA